MSRDISGLLHAYLAGVGKDSRGRLAADVLGFSESGPKLMRGGLIGASGA
jgi:hypothetical protein